MQRFTGLCDFENLGEYVLYEDHLREMAKLRQELGEKMCGCLAVQFGKCRFAGQTHGEISVEYGRIASAQEHRNNNEKGSEK